MIIPILLTTMHSKPETEWIKTYPSQTDFITHGLSLAITKKHIYVVGYTYQPNSLQTSIYLVVTDHDGNLVKKEKILLSYASGLSIKVEEINGSEYAYIVGYIFLQAGEVDIFLACFKNLNKAWWKTWGETNKIEAGYDLEIHEDKIYVVGDRYASSSKVLLVCFKKDNGAFLWQREWTKDKGAHGRRIAIRDHEIYVGGCVSKDKRMSLLLLKYKLDGTLTSAHEYDEGQNIYIFLSRMKLSNNHVYVTGERYNDLTKESSAILYKFNLNLDKIWERTYEGPADSIIRSYTGLQIQKDNIYVT